MEAAQSPVTNLSRANHPTVIRRVSGLTQWSGAIFSMRSRINQRNFVAKLQRNPGSSEFNGILWHRMACSHLAERAADMSRSSVKVLTTYR
jgi:hypothetical protein